MNILIVYATNSGSTYLIADHLRQQLEQHSHQITLKNVIEIAPQDLLNYDVVFLGSNSWDFERKEGQPHHAFVQFIQQANELRLDNHKYAIFGCGDRSYMIFCGALQVISEFVTSHGGTILHEPLRIDRFYFNDSDQIYAQADQWLSEVEKHF